MENLFIDIIKQAQKSKRTIAIYTDKEDTDRFSAGYVNNQMDEGLFLQAIDPNGFDDGIIFFNIDEIYAVEYDNKYLTNLEKIFKKKDKLQVSIPFIFNRNKDKNLIDDFLGKCHADRVLVTIKLIYGIGFTGYIKEIGAETVSVDIITDDGEKDGLAIIIIEDIDRIYLNGIDQKRIKILLEK